MKKFITLIFVMAITMVSINAFAQNPETPSKTKKVYCELLGTSKLLSYKVTVTIDYGQAGGWFKDNRLANEDGKVKDFNSMIDAMNYMGEMGWNFEQAYVVTVGQQNVYHWLLSKTIDADEEVQFNTKSTFKDKENVSESKSDKKRFTNSIYQN